MIAIGTVTGSEITTNKDGDEDTRMLQVEITNSEDLQSIEQVSQSGEDSNPQPGARVIILDLGPSYRVAVATDDGVTPSVSEGEKELYSYDTTPAKLAYIKLLSDSSIELNGDTDFAVAYTDLKTAFDQLKSDFNNFVSTIYGLHSHPTAPVGPVSPPSLVGTQSTADMSGAKVDSIKVP